MEGDYSGCDCDITVYFNTDFQYDLGSNFVDHFGGEENGHNEISEMNWSVSERPLILQKLQTYSQPLPDFAVFANNVSGTRILNNALDAFGHCPFRFGCLVYHQLGYSDTLSGIFQTGRCSTGPDCWHASNP